MQLLEWLKSWMSLIPNNTSQLAIITSLRVHPLHGCTNLKEWKLNTSFLKRFKVLEYQFRDLILSNVVKDEDFLMEKFDAVKGMNEKQFMELVINEKADEYRHFVR